MAPSPEAPDDPDAAVDAAVAQQRAGRLDEAAQAYAAILQAHPDNPRALHNFALLLISTGRFDEAEAILPRLEAGPQTGRLELRLRQAWGMALMGRGEDALAELQFLRACELAPDDPETHADLGLIRLRQGRPVEARASLERTLALAPDHVGALVNLGSALRQLRLYDAAEEAYQQALAAEPEHPVATRNLATLRREWAADVEAPGGPGLDVDLAGLTPEERMARAEALHAVGRLAEAADAYRAASEDAALRTRALIEAAFMLTNVNRHAEAIEQLDRAIAFEPEHAFAHHRRSLSRLRSGDYRGGWEDFEYRLRSQEFLRNAGPLMLVLDEVAFAAAPEQVAGQRVLLVGEQGIGDQVMFASLIPDILKTAASVTCVCNSRLVGLFARSFPEVTLLGVPGGKARVSDYDVVLAMGSLGRLYRNALEDFPGEPFLKTDPARVAGWTARLGPRTRPLRVGLSWRGGMKRVGDGGRQRGGPGQPHRSLSLPQLAPLLTLPQCEFVSLQYGEVADELAAANRRLEREIRSFPGDDFDDFDDFAALAEAMDVVVSVQNSLVHLCGAIGKDCLTPLSHNPEWRYTLSAEMMPWYRSVRLFRQAYAGDWIPVVQRVAEALQRRSPV